LSLTKIGVLLLAAVVVNSDKKNSTDFNTGLSASIVLM
jgi:hypothetical protein